MTFKWKKHDNEMYRGSGNRYGATIYGHSTIAGYGVHVWRDLGNSKQADLHMGIWSDGGLTQDNTCPTLKAAKQKAKEFAKQLSKLEI